MRDFQSPGRSPAYGRRAMAASSHPLASLAAIDALKAGGNAVDAAIAAVAVQAVVEPQSTGIGGDCFVLYAPARGRLIALNGSGAAPAAARAQWYRDQGIGAIPFESPHAVTVPGAVAAWTRLHADHGRLPFHRLMEPAAGHAEEGYPVHPRVARDWRASESKLGADAGARALFLPAGRAPEAGALHRQPALAATLRRIGAEGAQAFYRGPVAEEMVAVLRARGGLHCAADFAAAAAEYVEPVTLDYRGYTVAQCPPNGQGIVALTLLALLEGFDFARLDPLGPERFHYQAEASRLAFDDRDRFLADPRHAEVPVRALLAPERIARLRAAIDPKRAMGALPDIGLAPHRDTVYLCVVDGEGNAISFINSLFHAFGSGIFAPRSGVMLHNRGASFRTNPAHPNAIAPGKRPLHTIIPAMLLKAGRAVMPFGVMGGHYQPVGQAHLLTNMLDFGMDPQAAIDCPRGFAFEGLHALESGVPEATLNALARLGHAVARAKEPLGGGQAIWIEHSRGVLIGGSDPRKDGVALGI